MTLMPIAEYYGTDDALWHESICSLVAIASDFHTEKRIASACGCTVRTLRSWTMRRGWTCPKGGARRADALRDLAKLIAETER